jgi:hypothetical protein
MYPSVVPSLFAIKDASELVDSLVVFPATTIPPVLTVNLIPSDPLSATLKSKLLFSVQQNR